MIEDIKARTLRMLADPSTWPCVTHLCVKQSKRLPGETFPVCGIVRLDSLTVVRNHPDNIDGVFAFVYSSPEAMVGGGWIVD